MVLNLNDTVEFSLIGAFELNAICCVLMKLETLHDVISPMTSQTAPSYNHVSSNHFMKFYFDDNFHDIKLASHYSQELRFDNKLLLIFKAL